MLHLSRTANVLIVDSQSVKYSIRPPDKVFRWFDLRMQDSDTLASQRPQRGESTVALVRGSVTPTVQNGEALGSLKSMFATDLQVLDEKFGIMVLSYSLRSALARLRTAVSNGAMMA